MCRNVIKPEITLFYGGYFVWVWFYINFTVANFKSKVVKNYETIKK